MSKDTDKFVVKTPGKFPTGHEHKFANNVFHSGAIFEDDMSGIVQNGNQLSLGSVENIISKFMFMSSWK